MLISRCGNLLFFSILLAISFIHNVRSSPNSNCAANGAYCQTHYECCSRKCMTYSYVCAPVVHPRVNPNPPQYDYVPPNWWNVNKQRPIEEEIDIAILPDNKFNMGNHVVEKVDFPGMPQVDPVENRTCKPVGNDCSDSRDCCSFRCHSYLHRCVT